MKKEVIFLLVIGAILLISGCGLTGQATETGQKILDQATVARVIDGDTIELASGETIRLLHINTPEKGEHCYAEAKARLAELVLNRTLFLERDMENKDRYNRSLRYIYLGDDSIESVNQMMVEEGFAVAYILLPNTKYKNAFFEAEKSAISEKAGCLWQNQSKLYNCLQVIELKTCNEGDYALLKNNCDDINLDGWSLRDQSRSHYSLNGIIEEGASIRITRDAWETTHECIWSDYSNTLYIFDSNNSLVLRYGY